MSLGPDWRGPTGPDRGGDQGNPCAPTHRPNARAGAHPEAATPRHLPAPTPTPSLRRPAHLGAEHPHLGLNPTKQQRLRVEHGAKKTFFQRENSPCAGDWALSHFQSEPPKPHQALGRSVTKFQVSHSAFESLCTPAPPTDSHPPQARTCPGSPTLLSKPACQGLLELFPFQRLEGRSRGQGEDVLTATNIFATLIGKARTCAGV